MSSLGVAVAIASLMLCIPALAQTTYVTIGSAVVAIDTQTAKILGSSADAMPASLGKVAVTADGRHLLVTSSEIMRPDRVSQYDARSLVLQAFAEVGGRVKAVVASPDGRYPYAVSNHVMSIIDLATHTVAGVIPEGADEASAALTPDGRFLYVAASYGSVLVVDTAKRAIVARLSVGRTLGGLAMAPDGRRAYVADQEGNGLVVIDTRRREVVSRVPTGRGPVAVAVSRDGRTAYVAASGHNFLDTEAVRKTVTGSVSVIDLSTGMITRMVKVGPDPRGLVVTPDGSKVYVADGKSGLVSVIDPQRGAVLGTIAMEQRFILGIAIGPLKAN